MCDVKQDVMVNGKPFVWCECSGLDPAAVLEIDNWLKKMVGERINKRETPLGSLGDIHQTFRLGALKAAKTFDPKRGLPFINWATFKAKKELIDLYTHERPYEVGFVTIEPDAEFMCDDTSNDKAIIECEVTTLLSLLSLDEQQLLRDYYGIGTKKASMDEMMAKYVLSNSNICLKRSQAINKIKRFLFNKKLWQKCQKTA